MQLKIDMNKDGSTLNITIEGNLDTVTAPEFEKELNASLDGITDLRLDFTAVDYVSSAGLRVIIGASNRMDKQGSMVLKNVNADVMEVFEMTGFDELLTFE